MHPRMLAFSGPYAVNLASTHPPTTSHREGAPTHPTTPTHRGEGATLNPGSYIYIYIKNIYWYIYIYIYLYTYWYIYTFRILNRSESILRNRDLCFWHSGLLRPRRDICLYRWTGRGNQLPRSKHMLLTGVMTRFSLSRRTDPGRAQQIPLGL